MSCRFYLTYLIIIDGVNNYAIGKYLKEYRKEYSFWASDNFSIINVIKVLLMLIKMKLKFHFICTIDLMKRSYNLI